MDFRRGIMNKEIIKEVKEDLFLILRIWAGFLSFIILISAIILDSADFYQIMVLQLVLILVLIVGLIQTFVLGIIGLTIFLTVMSILDFFMILIKGHSVYEEK